MKRTAISLVLVVVVSAILLIFVRISEVRLDPNDVKAFEWFSSLGFPSSRGLQPVEVWNGGWSNSSHSDFKDQSTTRLGFLREINQSAFTFLSLRLIPSTYTEGTHHENPHRVRYQTRNMDQITAPFLLRKKAFLYEAEEYAGPAISLQFKDFLLGWHCWNQNRPDLAAKFLERLKLELDEGKTTPAENRVPLQQRIFAESTRHAFQLIIVAFNDPKSSRPELLGLLKNFLAKVPQAAEVKKAQQLAAGVEALIAEEQEHPLLSDELIEQFTPAARAAELVRRLRNTGFRVTDPRSSTRGKILKLGSVAVPALITAVDDNRPSRLAFFIQRSESPDGHLQSIGEVACDLLMERSGVRFQKWGMHGVYHPSPKQPSDLRKEIENWWSDYSRKGEKAQMIEAVANGSGDYRWHVRRLIDQYPADAGSAIVAGYNQLRVTSDKIKFLDLLDQFNDPHCIALLRRESVSGEHIRIKEVAAELLKDLKPNEPPH